MKLKRSQIFISMTLALQLASLPALAAEAAKKVVTLALATEPPQMNSMKATDPESFFLMGHVMEGLTRYGKSGENIPGVAEKWSINDKGATFNLRKNAMWSDGKPVTAKDFVFAWRTALEPKTASEYAFILYPLKNAEAINKGKMPSATLGVEASDDYTLKVTFEKPCGYFLSLTAFPTYMPVREDIYKQHGSKYAAESNTMIYNGPFTLTKWVHGASLRLDKNPNYWNQDAVQLDVIDIPYITPDNSARFNFFKDKKIDVLGSLSKDDLPKAQAQNYKMKSFSDGSVFFMSFNFRSGRATTNKNLRKAIQSVFNPDEYVSKVIGIPGTKPGRGLVPVWVRGTKDFFRKEYPMRGKRPDLNEAKKYLAAAQKELGGKIPALVWLTGDTPLASKEAEYFQNLFKSTLGIDLKIDKQIFKQRLAKMSSGDFDIVSAGWGPDFADPMTFAEPMASWNENNRGEYKNAEYDKLIRAAQSTADAKTRMDAMAEAEKIALEELAILPMYERTVVYLTHDRVQGLIRHTIGPDPDFTMVKVAE